MHSIFNIHGLWMQLVYFLNNLRNSSYFTNKTRFSLQRNLFCGFVFFFFDYITQASILMCEKRSSIIKYYKTANQDKETVTTALDPSVTY
jgi:hypothetical protein